MRARLSTSTGTDAIAIDRDWITGLVTGLVTGLYAANKTAPVSPVAAARAVLIADQLGDADTVFRICAYTQRWHPESRASLAARVAKTAAIGGSTYDAARILGLPRDAAYLWLCNEHLDDLWPRLLAGDPEEPPPTLPADRNEKAAAAVGVPRPKRPADMRTPEQRLIDAAIAHYNTGADLKTIALRIGIGRHVLLQLLRRHDKAYLAQQLLEEERDG